MINRNILLLVIGAAALTAIAAQKPYREQSPRRKWFSLVRPRKQTPAAQLAFANEVHSQNKLRAAARQYLALVRYWPESEEAARAQFQYASILDKRGKPEMAFDEYQVLFERYPNMFESEAVLQRQFEIAKSVMNKRVGRFLFLPGFQAPERAIPLLEKVIKNGPQASFAPEAQYLLGLAHEKSLEYEKAIEAYDNTIGRYPTSPYAELAAYRKVLCLERLSKESPRSQNFHHATYEAAAFYLTSYPQGAYVDEVRSISTNAWERKARIALEIADYYNRSKQYNVAARYYQQCIDEFPTTAAAQIAQERIKNLPTARQGDQE